MASTAEIVKRYFDALDIDLEQARASIRKLAELEPATVWTGHADPITGNVRAQLELAASAPI